jgi:Ca-activated chloride channel family protein
MFQFDNYSPRLLLFVPVLLVLLFVLQRRGKKIIGREIFSKIREQVLLGYSKSSRDSLFQLVLLLFIGSFLLLALFRPQYGFTWREFERSGADIVFAVDCSESMLAEDIAPNRLQRARQKIADILMRLKGDRVGLVAFAGVAFVEVPLTVDYSAFKSFLSELSPALLPVQGTNIELALRKSIDALTLKEQSKDNQQLQNRAIILITDGEEFNGDLSAIRSELLAGQIKLYILGVGTKEGAPIPLRNGGRVGASEHSMNRELKRDRSGKVVITRLVSAALEKLAKDTGGAFVETVSTDSDTQAIYEAGLLPTLQEQVLGRERTKIWNEYFQIPLGIAVLLLAILYLYRFRSGIMLALLCLVYVQPAVADEQIGAEAKQAYEQGRFEDAIKLFDRNNDESDYRNYFGKGVALYRLEKYEEAIKNFSDAYSKSPDKSIQAQALYNSGNANYQLKKYQEAVESYKKALTFSPHDQEIKENLKLAEEMLKNEQQQKKEEKKEEQKEEKKEEENKEEQKKEQQQQSEQQKEQQPEQQSGQQSEEQKEPDKEKQEKQNNEQNNNKQQDKSQEEPKQELKPKNDQEGKEEKKEEEKTAENSKENPEQQPDQKPEQNQDEQQQQAAQSAQPGDEQDKYQGILGSIQENFGSTENYRNLKALQELRSQSGRIPERDW